ncbi:MAG: DEAD/DEAH box helicase [Bryobacteraceae bacterium]|jgi:ATP-dependent RNA helicase RhlE
MNTFSELTLSPLLQANLAKNGFVTPTPVQAESIPGALSGRDIVATAQTGTGKTLAFVLPMLEMLSKKSSGNIDAIVLSPTRELAMQIQEAFTKIASGTGIRAATVVGGINENNQLKSIRAGARVLIATPGRLCDFLNRRLVKLGAVSMLVLDEADRMLDMGFLPAIQSITAALPAKRQNLLFSATIENSVKHLIERYSNDPLRVAIGSMTKPAEDVDLHLYEVGQDGKLALLQQMLKDAAGSYLVFARTKRGADKLARQLSVGGFKTACIHGDRTQSQRNQALKSFQQGHHRVLVATDVAARGIHVDGISHVINFDLPQAPEDFIHRVGRTGRAGARGTASTFATPSERGMIRQIERLIGMQLIRHSLTGEVLRDQKVIVLPVARNTRSFKPRARRQAGR